MGTTVSTEGPTQKATNQIFKQQLETRIIN